MNTKILTIAFAIVLSMGSMVGQVHAQAAAPAATDAAAAPAAPAADAGLQQAKLLGGIKKGQAGLHKVAAPDAGPSDAVKEAFRQDRAEGGEKQVAEE